jgi:exonuclease SbcC
MTAAQRATEELDAAKVTWDTGEMDRLREEHEAALKAEEGLRSRIAHQEDLLRRMVRNVEGLEDKVERRRGVLERRELHVHVSDWLSDRLVPAVRAMERSVMAMMADEMDAAASDWFNQLVEDPDLVLTVDEDFVPVVTHQDYEMDLGALSGGERTAAAFAYRLALNGLVRTHATPGQSNLLMLDEPTDGFSREQLARMGYVFSELAAEQVVVVSHDRELRAFADRVYLVEKGTGASTVRQVA